MNKKFLVAGLALALTACGTPKQSADAINATGGTGQGQGDGGRLSTADFQAQCAAKSKSSFTSTDLNFCIVPTGVSIDNGYADNGKLLVDADYHAGKYIVSHGTRGAAILLLGTSRVGSEINYRQLGPLTSGALYLQVLQSSQSKTDVTSYTCFDYNLHEVYCNDGIIP